jgi:hypothetical protein
VSIISPFRANLTVPSALIVIASPSSRSPTPSPKRAACSTCLQHTPRPEILTAPRPPNPSLPSTRVRGCGGRLIIIETFQRDYSPRYHPVASRVASSETREPRSAPRGRQTLPEANKERNRPQQISAKIGARFCDRLFLYPISQECRAPSNLIVADASQERVHRQSDMQYSRSCCPLSPIVRIESHPEAKILLGRVSISVLNRSCLAP